MTANSPERGGGECRMKMTEYPLLSSSIKIGNVTFRNRIIASPTSVPKL